MRNHVLVSIVLCFILCAITASARPPTRVQKVDQEPDQELHCKTSECAAVGDDDPNCLYRCANPKCYESIFASDPLEPGEVDSRRDARFRSCQGAAVRDAKKAAREEEKRHRERQRLTDKEERVRGKMP